MSWAFWIFLAVVALCISGLIAQWKQHARREAISQKQYEELRSQLAITQTHFARLAKVVKPVVMKTLGPQKAGELLTFEKE